MAKVRPLPPALIKIAKEELNEDSDTINDYIENLRNWILKQPHLNVRNDDQSLLTFLRTCKYSLEKAKRKIDYFYTCRSSITELYGNRDTDDPRIREIIKLGIALRIQATDGEAGQRITIIRGAAYDPDKYTFVEILKIGTMIADIGFLEDDNAVVAGQVEILDLANATPKHLANVDFSFLRKLSRMAEMGSPIRDKGIHFINTPPGFELIFNTFKTFLSEKKQKRLFVHGSNMESLYEHIPRHILPKEYGGTNGCVQDLIEYWEKKILSYRDFFKEDLQYRNNESLRIGKRINPETLFGVEGSFRMLNID